MFGIAHSLILSKFQKSIIPLAGMKSCLDVNVPSGTWPYGLGTDEVILEEIKVTAIAGHGVSHEEMSWNPCSNAYQLIILLKVEEDHKYMPDGFLQLVIETSRKWLVSY